MYAPSHRAAPMARLLPCRGYRSSCGAHSGHFASSIPYMGVGFWVWQDCLPHFSPTPSCPSYLPYFPLHVGGVRLKINASRTCSGQENRGGFAKWWWWRLGTDLRDCVSPL
jgi:hypothetical protein